jgi:purine-nucleoside phosphorylase
MHMMSVSQAGFLTGRVQPNRDRGFKRYTGEFKANEGTMALVYGLGMREKLG